MRPSIKQGCRLITLVFLFHSLVMGKAAFAVDAPQPFVTGSTINWPAVSAMGINVHLGNGDYLTSIPGTATQWTPTLSGNYFLVSTDSGSWMNWGRSQTVSVNLGSVGTGPAPLAPQNFRVDVYSQSALELFWNHASDFSSQGITYTLRQDGEILVQNHTGSSWFVEGLAPGRTYQFQLEAVASSSTSSVGLELSATTPGSFQQPAGGTNPPTEPTNNLAAPTNVVASVYSETAAEVFWDRSESAANNRVDYQVFLNDENVGTTDGTSLFFGDLLSGTAYTIRIEANSGSQVSASEILSFTTRGVSRLTPVGRPAVDANTHGFGFWDNMTFEQQQRFPSDCLFAGGQFSTIAFGGTPSVCFSPLRRELINSARFRFSLPGDNATNHVEAIEWVNASAIALIADITTEFGQSRYELSLFQQSGQFTFTQPILNSIVNPANAGPRRAINLDGKDIRERRDGGSRGGERSSRIYIIGEYYELNPNGNPSTISGWRNVGAFAAKYDTTTGELLSETFYEGRSQESITSDDFVDFIVGGS